MDMLSWTSLNPTVKEVDTKKKFFGVYLYKITVYAPGGRIVAGSTNGEPVSVKELLEFRITTLRHRAYRWSGLQTARTLEENARIDQIEYFIEIKEKYSNDIKIRIEEPTITVYSNDLELLHKIASTKYPGRLVSVHQPRNDKARLALDDGHILTSKAAIYSHKIVLRDHVFKEISVKHSIGDYLYNLGDEIQMTKSLKRNLSSNFGYFMGGYFYCKDDRTITFINLICPNLVSGIYKLSEPVQ